MSCWRSCWILLPLAGVHHVLDDDDALGSYGGATEAKRDRMYLIEENHQTQGGIMNSGLNNTGFLGINAQSCYDSASPNITENRFWRDPGNGKFWHVRLALFVIKRDIYMTVIRGLSKRLLG